MNRPKPLAAEAGPRAGDVLPVRRWTVGKDDLLRFADFLYPARPDNPQRLGNPHLDEEYARKHLYGGLIVDGNQTVALICEMVEDWLPGVEAGAAATEADFSFPNPCCIGDVIEFHGEVMGTRAGAAQRLVDLKFEARNQHGKLVAVGTLGAVLPPA
ncbi:MAG: MaoC family dehydratase [Burkholderiales bacterium]|nr:MaoC family dehydratase [Burkholderiales bacterium]